MSAAKEGAPRARVREVLVATLRPWGGNPRLIASGRMEGLKGSLLDDPAMLWARPLIALLDGTVICGNQRLRAAVELGWERIPVLYVDLSWERAKVWALRDNNQWGEWDDALLAELLAELGAGGVDLALAGFESRDLDRLLAGFQQERDPDDAPPLPTGKPDSKPGKIYELGAHLLLCGDAGESVEVERLFAGELAEVVWTDPPYGVDYVGKTRAALTIQNDSKEGLPALLECVFAAADRVLAPLGRFYVAAPAGPQGTVFRFALEGVGWRFHQALVWVKSSPVLGHSDHHFQHEDVLYGWKPGPGRPGRGRHRGSRWYGDNSQTTVFSCARPVRSELHPTMKPVALVAAMLRNSSRRGDIVFDPFAGSGSTLIACEELGRRCFAVELDPRYCDVIRERYARYTDGD